MVYMPLDDMWALYKTELAKVPMLSAPGVRSLIVDVAAQTLPYPIDVRRLINKIDTEGIKSGHTAETPRLHDAIEFTGRLCTAIQTEAERLSRTEGDWRCIIPWKAIKAEFDTKHLSQADRPWTAQQRGLELICQMYIPFPVNYADVWHRFDIWGHELGRPTWPQQWKYLRKQIQQAADVAVNLWDK